MKTRWLLIGLVALGVAGVQLRAQGPADGGSEAAGAKKSEKSKSPDEQAIADQAVAFVKAFNSGDAHAVAEMYADNARLIDCAGEVAEGREAIEREYKALFEENPGLKIEVLVDDLRVVSADAAIEEGATRVTPKDGAQPVVNRYSVVSIKKDGKWKFASVRETPGDLTVEEHLKPIAWMVGEWVDESSDSSIRSTCRWAPHKQALIREFSIITSGEVVMSGTQRIGWDPRAEQIKSWEFDSEGGHGEGLWAQYGDRWIIKATAVLRDGRTATATHVITPVDSNTCRWRTSDRTVGSHVIPEVDDFVMVRPAPGPKAK